MAGTLRTLAKTARQAIRSSSPSSLQQQRHAGQPARQAQQVHRGLAHSEGAHRANVQVGRRDLEEGVRLGGPGAFRGLQNLHIRVQEERPQIWSEGKRVYVTVAGLRDPSVCSRS